VRIKAPIKESQPIHPTQHLLGSALRDRFENADCDMPIFASPFWANMIHALDVDKPEPWPDGQDRQKD
jgi:hypothetical protein